MTKRTVLIKNRKTGEEREAFLNDTEDAIVNARGEEYDYMLWGEIMPSPHFLWFCVAMIGVVALMAALAVFGGES